MTSDDDQPGGSPLLDRPRGAPDWVPSVDDERSISRLWWLLGIVLAAGVVAFLLQGSNNPADPVVGAGGESTATLTPAPIGGRVPIEGFGEVSVRVTDGDEALERCLLLAATVEQRARGLMTVDDPTLGGYDGMLFEFDTDTTGGFYMRNTPMPLSIAWLDTGGRLVSQTDMTPCPDQEGCPNYFAEGPYRYALEVPQGRLGAFGISPTSVLTVGESSCPRVD